ncbi:MAG: hypothetical protein ISS64_05085 [Desulfobacterales bacterium]|nr:hypothetical protein [Desulfobacterales bacterium]
MSHESRKKLIEKIQKKRGSKIISYFLSDRGVVPDGISLPGIKANIAQDVKTVFHDVLREIGKQQNLDLFIYTRGGDTNAVWPIVSLFREYSDNFEVLVPFRSHSAGTMICLGANKIHMSKIGELSPIDPQTGNQFNPLDDINKRTRKGISVEDLTSYYDLAKENFDLKKDVALDVFKELTKVVHPLALGNVKRVLSQSEFLSRKLLGLHIDTEKDKERIDKITSAFTTEFFSHLHFINRKEALEILGDEIIVYPDDELEGMMYDLLDSYTDGLKVKNNFCIFDEMGNDNQKEFELYAGIIENDAISYSYKTKLKISQRSKLPQNMNVNIQPGQHFPIIPGLPKTIYTEVLSQDWIINHVEV